MKSSVVPQNKSLIFIILGLLIIASFGVRTISHPDIWTHLATGRVVADQGIPREDMLTFSMAGSDWVADSWLYDWILYRLWNVGSGALVTLVHVLVVLGIYLFLIPAARKWAHGTTVGFGLLLSAWLLAPGFTAQPLLVGFFFAAFFIFILEQKPKLWKLVAALVPAQILWTNMHVSFLLGPALCALYAVQDAAASRDSQGRGARTLGAVAIGLLAATVLNPYGLVLHRIALGGMLDPARLYVQEWVSPFSNLFLPSTARHFVTLTLIIGAGGLITQRQKLPVALTTLAVVSAFLAIRSLLSVVTLAVFAFPFICLSLQAIGDTLSSILEKAAKVNAATVRRTAVAVFTLIVILSLSLVTSNRYYTREGSASSFGLGVQEDIVPSAALDLMQKDYFPERVLNAFRDGGYLAWSIPGRRTFVDTRHTLFGADFYQRAVNGVLRGEPDTWLGILNEWKPGAVLVNASANHAGTATQSLIVGGGWSLVYFDGTTAVFMQPLSHYADLIANMETQAAGLKVLDESYREYLSQLGGWSRPAVSPRLLGAANVFLALSRYEEAAALFDALTRGAPAMAGAWLSLGICQIQMGKTEEAIGTLETAAQLLPKKALCWLWLSRAYAQNGQTDEAGYAYERANRLNANVASAFGNPLAADRK